MCIIALCEERKLTEQEVKNCFKSNPDGAGIAWRWQGKNYYVKGFMTEEQLLEGYENILGIPHIVHFRNATAGGVKPLLTHPYIVSKKSPLHLTWSGSSPLLFHNGVVSGWQKDLVGFYTMIGEKIPKGPWSDTRLVAVMVKKLGEHFLDFADGKYVLLDTKYKMWGDFTKEKGVYFSNTGYKGYKVFSGYGGYGGYEDIWDRDGFGRPLPATSKGRWWKNDAYKQYAKNQDKVETAAKNSPGNNGKASSDSRNNNAK